MKSKWYLLFGIVATLAFALTACQTATTTTTTTTTGGQTVDLGEKTINTSFGYGDIPTLDPSKAQDTSSIQVAIELFPTDDGWLEYTRVGVEMSAHEGSAKTISDAMLKLEGWMSRELGKTT